MLRLLGECAPKAKHQFANKGNIQSGAYTTGSVEEKTPETHGPTSANLEATDSPDKIIKFDSIRKPEHIRGKSGTLPARSSFFVQISSQAMLDQSKWVDDEAVPMIMLPLIEPSSKVAIQKSESGEIQFLKKVVKSYNLLSALITLDCVVTQMNFDTCVAAQKRCIAILSELRKSIPTESPGSHLSNKALSVGSSPLDQLSRSAVSPLEIVSAKIIKVSTLVY